jgi:hypothetical protein
MYLGYTYRYSKSFATQKADRQGYGLGPHSGQITLQTFLTWCLMEQEGEARLVRIAFYECVDKVLC